MSIILSLSCPSPHSQGIGEIRAQKQEKGDVRHNHPTMDGKLIPSCSDTSNPVVIGY